jgi:coenzyme F420-reducing hydrogenase alpha subunit
VNASTEPTDPAREGLEHLQAAAREMIAAARSMLDAVEELMEDPQAASSITSAFGTVGRLIEGAVSQVSGIVGGSASSDDDEPRVQRIKVS